MSFRDLSGPEFRPLPAPLIEAFLVFHRADMVPFGLIEIGFGRFMVDGPKADQTNRVERTVVVLAMGEMAILSL